MRIRIRIQQLKLMRIHADADPDPETLLKSNDNQLVKITYIGGFFLSDLCTYFTTVPRRLYFPALQ